MKTNIANTIMVPVIKRQRQSWERIINEVREKFLPLSDEIAAGYLNDRIYDIISI